MRRMAIARPERIDTPSTASISFRPPELEIAARGAQTEGRFHDVAIAAGHSFPGRPNLSPGRVVHNFPIQRAKVQRPPLPAATLHRHRLFQWLDDHISRRVVFVTAEAGYGKTTLLADWG